MSPDSAGHVGLPDEVASAASQAAEELFRVLSPMMTTHPSPQASALWQVAKLLNAVSGRLELGSVPEAGRPRARWAEAATLGSAITRKALEIVAAGMTPEEAAEWLADADASDVYGTAASYGGVIELVPPDQMETGRTLTVTFDHRHVRSVTADRGPAPEPRPHTAAAVLRASHHLDQLAEVLGELVLEPWEDGIPLFGRATKDVTCEVCQRDVGADVARTIQVDKPWHHEVRVCSVTCARAAHAGEHNG